MKTITRQSRQKTSLAPLVFICIIVAAVLSYGSEFASLDMTPRQDRNSYTLKAVWRKDYPGRVVYCVDTNCKTYRGKSGEFSVVVKPLPGTVISITTYYDPSSYSALPREAHIFSNGAPICHSFSTEPDMIAECRWVTT